MPEFLFDVVRLQRRLAVLPELSAQLQPPATEGGASSSYPTLRKTSRQVYRLLTNVHYRNLRDGLRAIESTHAAGCRFDRLLVTDVYEQFQSHMFEVRAAELFLCRSFDVASIPRAQGRTADLHVTGHGIDATVEVFTRREWLGLASWTDGVRDDLKNIDHPVDFALSVSTESRASRLWSPWELSDAFATTGNRVLAEIAADFEVAVEALTPFRKTYLHADTDLETLVEIYELRRSGDAPRRRLSISTPGFGGYSPAGMLRRIVDGPLREKAGRGQAQTAASGLRCLVVDLSRSGIAQDLRHPAHARQAQEVVADVDPTEFDLDLVAFYRPYSGRLRGRCDYFAAFDDTNISRAQVERLFGTSTVV